MHLHNSPVACRRLNMRGANHYRSRNRNGGVNIGSPDDDEKVVYLENDSGDEKKCSGSSSSLVQEHNVTQSPQYQEVFHIPRLRSNNSSRSTSDETSQHGEEKQSTLAAITSEEMTSFAPKVSHETTPHLTYLAFVSVCILLINNH